MSNKILKSYFFPEKINLLNLNHKNLCHLFLKLGEPCFRAEQVMKWIYHYYCDDFMKMNNLKKKLRNKLHEIAVIFPPKFKKKKNQLMER